MYGIALTVFCFIASLPSIKADFDAIAGYEPRNDVSEHLELDLDMQNVVESSETFDFQAAYNAYAEGGNSVRTDDAAVVRTLEGFSNNDAKLQGEKWYDIFVQYWSANSLYTSGNFNEVYSDESAYAHEFTSSACNGTGLFEESTTPLVSEASRSECCQKGAAYQNVWMYVIHEMEAAIEDCISADYTGAHWDEAVAFYTGSLVGSDASESIGVMLFSLAEKRCTNFGTCIGNDDDIYQSQVNANIFQLFTAGRDYYELSSSSSTATDKCELMEQTKEAIVLQMTIPLIQGVLRYLYLADSTEEEKSRAELWAFAAAVLPVIDYYDSDVATSLYNNALLTNEVTVPDGYVEVKDQLESIYEAMGLSCSDIGGLVSTTYDSGYFPGMEPCSDSDSSSTDDNSQSGSSSSNSKKKNDDNDDKVLQDWGIALIVIFVVVAVAGCFIGGIMYGKKLGAKEGNLRLDAVDGSELQLNAV